jgi:hypothetical protein
MASYPSEKHIEHLIDRANSSIVVAMSHICSGLDGVRLRGRDSGDCNWSRQCNARHIEPMIALIFDLATGPAPAERENYAPEQHLASQSASPAALSGLHNFALLHELYIRPSAVW